jgi:UDP-N-acetylglucosamine enolpyruvyl transferase
VQHVDRGYQQFVEALQGLGATIVRRVDETLI